MNTKPLTIAQILAPTPVDKAFAVYSALAIQARKSPTNLALRKMMYQALARYHREYNNYNPFAERN
jgi:hypothetical protein